MTEGQGVGRRIWEGILGVFVVALCAGVLIQVILRYALKVSFPAIEEIVSISFIYTIFLGAALGMKRAEHLEIDFLLKKVPPRLRGVYDAVILAGTALFLLFVVKEGIVFVIDSYSQTTTYLNLPISYAYAAIPGSAILMLYYLLRRSFALVRSRREKGPREDSA
jgi:TRAP-type transport system small permease protein